jgi:hypothetical protein
MLGEVTKVAIPRDEGNIVIKAGLGYQRIRKPGTQPVTEDS